MAEVMAARVTANMKDPFVVFLIGMRVNKFFAFKKWWLGASTFPKMVNELSANPELGFLHGESFFRFAPLTTIMVSYWRSFEQLEHFARSRDHLHLPAWQEFYKRVGTDGTVGIWHETYQINPGQSESIYANMPLFGLAAASEAVPVTRANQTARMRVTGKPEATTPPVPAVEEKAEQPEHA